MILGVFSIVGSLAGIKGLLKLIGSGLPDLTDPAAMEAFQQALLQDALGTDWIGSAATVAAVIVGVWVIVDLFRVKRDGTGIPFA